MEVTDPVSLTWSLKLQNNINLLDSQGTDRAVQAGFILPPDAELMMTTAAAESDIGNPGAHADALGDAGP